MSRNKKNADEDYQPICGNCICCICTNLGYECSLTDNPVEYTQPGCIDHIPDEN